jgi:hypothetical protein
VRLTEITVDGRPVAFTRIVLSISLVIVALEVSAYWWAIGEGRMSYPYWSVLPTPNAGGAGTLLAAATVLSILLGAGVLAGPVAGLASMLCLVALLSDQQTYSNHLVLLTLLLAFLSVAQSDRRWSVAARRSTQKQVPWWPQLLLVMQVSVCYVFAGLSKLNPHFLSGDTLDAFVWADLSTQVLVLMSVGAIVTELALGLMLWFRPTRWMAAALGVGLHAGILVMTAGAHLVFAGFALMCLAVYPLFLTKPSLREVGGTEATAGSAVGGSAGRLAPDVGGAT